jgi:peroxiredoxin
MKRECFASISKAGGFDLPTTWADARLASVGVASVTVLPEQNLTLLGKTVHCNVLEVVYDDYHARIRKTTNTVRYWIDVRAGLLRQITFSEVLAQGTRDWTVTVERTKTLASLTPPAQQNTTSASPLVGQEAPDFALAANDGSHFQLSALRGKTVVLDFWATWCGPCLEEIPDLEKLQQNASSRTIILGISDDDEPTVREWERKYGRSFRTLVGARGTFDAYGVKPLPTLVMINKQGIVTDFTVGFHLLNELEKITADH